MDPSLCDSHRAIARETLLMAGVSHRGSEHGEEEEGSENVHALGSKFPFQALVAV